MLRSMMVLRANRSASQHGACAPGNHNRARLERVERENRRLQRVTEVVRHVGSAAHLNARLRLRREPRVLGDRFVNGRVQAPIQGVEFVHGNLRVLASASSVTAWHTSPKSCTTWRIVKPSAIRLAPCVVAAAAIASSEYGRCSTNSSSFTSSLRNTRDAGLKMFRGPGRGSRTHHDLCAADDFLAMLGDEIAQIPVQHQENDSDCRGQLFNRKHDRSLVLEQMRRWPAVCSQFCCGSVRSWRV